MNINSNKRGEIYESPAVTLVEVSSEQILCQSFSSINESYEFVGGNEGEDWI